MKKRSPFLSFVVALLLLLSQQLAFAHGVTHLGEGQYRASRDQHPTEQVQCEQCLALAAIGSAIIATPNLPLAISVRNPVISSEPTERFVPITFRSFNSRAPPGIS